MIAAFVLPVKGKFVLKVSVLIIELKSSPNLKHYPISQDTPNFTFWGVKLGVNEIKS